HESSAPHARVPEPVPASWLDRILGASMHLPLDGGDHAVVTTRVESMELILPDHAVGPCYAPDPESARHEQLVIKRLPEGIAETATGIDPTRVFPSMLYEHVAPVPGSAS